MNEILGQVKRLEGMIGQVVPVLVIDEWKEANEQLPQVFSELAKFLQLLIAHQSEFANVELTVIQSILERLIYAMNVSDSIQIADLLLYELRGVFQNIYVQYENA